MKENADRETNVVISNPATTAIPPIHACRARPEKHGGLENAKAGTNTTRHPAGSSHENQGFFPRKQSVQVTVRDFDRVKNQRGVPKQRQTQDFVFSRRINTPTTAMGHSARSKSKREIRAQRVATVGGTEREKLQQDKVQMALERAAAAPKVPVPSSRAPQEERDDEADKDDLANQFDDETVSAVREAQQESVSAARWGITAPAVLKTRRGQVTKNSGEKARQGGKAKLTAAASFSNDSRKRKDQKKLFKALATSVRR